MIGKWRESVEASSESDRCAEVKSAYYILLSSTPLCRRSIFRTHAPSQSHPLLSLSPSAFPPVPRAPIDAQLSSSTQFPTLPSFPKAQSHAPSFKHPSRGHNCIPIIACTRFLLQCSSATHLLCHAESHLRGAPAHGQPSLPTYPITHSMHTERNLANMSRAPGLLMRSLLSRLRPGTDSPLACWSRHAHQVGPAHDRSVLVGYRRRIILCLVFTSSPSTRRSAERGSPKGRAVHSPGAPVHPMPTATPAHSHFLRLKREMLGRVERGNWWFKRPLRRTPG